MVSPHTGDWGPLGHSDHISCLYQSGAAIRLHPPSLSHILPLHSLGHQRFWLDSLTLILYVGALICLVLRRNFGCPCWLAEINFTCRIAGDLCCRAQTMDMMDTHSLSRGRFQCRTVSVCRSLRFGEVPIVYQLPAPGPGRAGSHAESCSRRVFVMQSQSRLPAAELSWILLGSWVRRRLRLWGVIGWFQLDGV